MQKDLVLCRSLIAECKDPLLSQVPTGKRSQHLKLFELEAKVLGDIIKDLGSEDKQEGAIPTAQRASKGFRDEAKVWKKAKLVYA